MYPLDVILIGCGDGYVGRDVSLRAQVRRELSNLLACVKHEFRDVDGAVKDVHLAKNEHVLFLIALNSMEDLAALQKLSAAFLDQPILALRAADSDRQLFLGALRSGAAFAIPVPFESEDFKAGLEWVCREFGFVPKQSLLVAVAGVNSAAGATTLALNLASEIGTMVERHCVLAELAVRLGVLATYLNVEPRFTLYHLIDDLDTLDVDLVRQVLTPINEHLDLLSGPQETIQQQSLPVDAMMRLLRYLRPLADVVVADVPCTYDDLYFEALAAADKVVLVMEQKLPSVRAMQMVRDALHRRQVPVSKVTIVVNRYQPQVTGFSAEDLAQHLHVPKVVTIANDHAAVSAAINNGRPLRQQAPNSRALADIAALVRPLLDLRDRPAAQGSLFNRVARAIGLT